MAKKMRAIWEANAALSREGNQILLKLFGFALIIAVFFHLFFPRPAAVLPTSKASGVGEEAGSLLNATIGGLQRDMCDLFSGEWIPNNSRPAYTNESCPFIEPPQNCMKNGRPDTGYLYWRWKPHGCDVSPFDGDKFLEAMRNKTWALIGDSIFRNHAQSLICLLSKRQILAATASEETKLSILEREIRSREIAEGADQPRHPVPQLGQHFVTESSQSQSLDAAGTERLMISLIDFLGAEKAFGEAESISEGISQRRTSLEGPVEERAPPPVLRLLGPADFVAEKESKFSISLGHPRVTEEIQGADEPVITKAKEPVMLSTEECPTISAVSMELEKEILEKLKSSEEVGTSLEIPEALKSQGQDSGSLIGGEVLAAATATATAVEPFADPILSGDQMITLFATQLERFIERVMMKRLSNNWSLDAYKKKIDDCLKRSYENKDSLSRMDQRMSSFENILKDVQKGMTELGEGSTAHGAVAANLRKDIDLAVVHHNMLENQVSQLHETTEKHTAESLVLLGDVHKMGAEGTTKWSKHETDHGAVNARLSALEELRRLDNINTGQENASKLYSVKMDGFQMCLEVQVANGTFNRRLLNNQAFMNLVKDKDALLAKIAEKDRQIPWRAGPNTQEHYLFLHLSL